jgi:hypothetical protein
LFERLVTFAGLVPTPMVETFHAVIVARAIMVGTKLGVFDVLVDRPLAASAAAQRLGVNEAALEKLLNVLVATGYLSSEGAGYGLTPLARKWMLRDAPGSLRDSMLLRFLEWQAIEGTEDFVRTGTALDVHDRLQGDEWGTYQRGMRSLARLSAGEVARCIPFPRTPGRCSMSAGRMERIRSGSAAGIRICARRFSTFRKRRNRRCRCWPKRSWASASFSARETR